MNATTFLEALACWRWAAAPRLQAIEIARLRPDLQLVACDFSQEFTRLGERNRDRARVGPVQFTVADAMDLSRFARRSFDAVYSLTAIKHFPDPVRGLTPCWRACRGRRREGGRMQPKEMEVPRPCSCPSPPRGPQSSRRGPPAPWSSNGRILHSMQPSLSPMCRFSCACQAGEVVA
ncbi:MAG: class I SAM-dependent methyltransferase [Myxococcales bacterium]